MKILTDIDLGPELQGSVLSLGNFDGVHVGHQDILRTLTGLAHELGAPALVMTFSPHPIQLLHPGQAPAPLTRLETRLDLLSRFGLTGVVVMPTTPELLAMEPETFFAEILVKKLSVRGLVEGSNFNFGHDRRGDVDLLQQLAQPAGVVVQSVGPCILDGDVVSSTRIRRALKAGHVHLANRLLARAHGVSGRVVEGDKRGRTIGFPTANLADLEELVPGDGVYAGRARVGEQWFSAAINIGPRPTFGQQARCVEAHLLDFTGDLYGQTLQLEFLRRLRDIRRFDSARELTAQLGKDRAAARAETAAVD